MQALADGGKRLMNDEALRNGCPRAREKKAHVLHLRRTLTVQGLSVSVLGIRFSTPNLEYASLLLSAL